MSGTEPEFVYIQKWLNNRQYGGKRDSNETLLSHDDYWRLIALYRRARGVSDEIILKNLAPTLTHGSTLNLYCKIMNNFTRLTDLENEMRHEIGAPVNEEVQKLLSIV